jgi:hypothetical protein
MYATEHLRANVVQSELVQLDPTSIRVVVTSTYTHTLCFSDYSRLRNNVPQVSRPLSPPALAGSQIVL